MGGRMKARNAALAMVLTTTGLIACTGILGVTEVPDAITSVDAPEAGDVQAVDVQETPEADAGDGGAIVYVPKPCEKGAKQCYGATPQTCTANGEWASETACPYVCKSGACTGVCLPDTKQCAGATPQTCDSNGQWQSEAVCANACQNGACTGVCAPSSKQCSGNGVQTCDGNGAWAAAVACAPSTPACSGGGSCGSPPSCSGLTNNCGGSAGTDNCCSSIVVPEGAFYRSSDTSYPATISSFRLDTYEVTVGRFRKFLASYSPSMMPSGAGRNPNNPSDTGWDTGWNTYLPADLQAALKCSATYPVWTDSLGPNENRPVNCVTWFEAQAFCIWDGGRLPTEAEWNYAAAAAGRGGGGGGLEPQRKYPWFGDTIDPSRASYWVNSTNLCFGDGIDGCSVADFTFVGTKSDGKTPLGHVDLGGNVWEWVQDFYTEKYPTNTCSDCATVSGGTSRLARGGSFLDVATALETATRGTAQAPTARNFAIGVRCARGQ